MDRLKASQAACANLPLSERLIGGATLSANLELLVDTVTPGDAPVDERLAELDEALNDDEDLEDWTLNNSDEEEEDEDEDDGKPPFFIGSENG